MPLLSGKVSRWRGRMEWSCSLRTPDSSGINNRALPRDDAEAHIVPGNFGEHENVVGIETLAGEFGLTDVPFAKLGAGSDDEIVNTHLRLDPLVEVFMSRQDDVDAVANHYRFENLSQFEIGTVLFT